ncbi:O-antigen ligase family protein [Salinicoccus bachuensis]|uniref:O-antigen ligase family protein n=1 Tax=Salinicoccus bachuensis TaxID=3136731 RepID=A0ABZ3CKC2_9STAP
MDNILREKGYINLNLYMILPFGAIVLLPSQYSSLFRFNTPVGELRIDFIFLLIVLVSMIFLSLKKIYISPFRLLSSLIILNTLFLIINLASIFVNGFTLEMLRYVIYIFIISFGMIILVGISWKKVDYHKVIIYSIYFSTIVCMIAILEFFNVFRFYSDLYLEDNVWFSYYEGSSNIRVTSSIGNPLVLSAFLLLMVNVILYVKEISAKKVFWYSILLIHFLTILATQSRSAFICLLIILGYHYFLDIKKNLTVIFAIIISTSTFLVILDYLQADQNFINRLLFKEQSASFNIRYEAYLIAAEMLKDIEIISFGVGPNRVNSILDTINTRVQTLDNVFLMTFISTGIFGLLIFTLIFIFIWMKLHNVTYRLKLFGRGLVITMVVMGFSFNITYFSAIWGVFWFYIGIIIMLNSAEKEKVIH